MVSSPWTHHELPDFPMATQADEQLRTVGAWRYGCTATVCLVRRMVQSVRIHVAWTLVQHWLRYSSCDMLWNDGLL